MKADQSFFGLQGWQWIRQDCAAWSLDEDVLVMRVLPGTIWGARADGKNILLRPETTLAAGCACGVTVANQPQLPGEQAGLIWYRDDDNYIKLVKEFVDEQVVVFAREEAGQPAVVVKVSLSGETASLRLAFDGENVQAYYRVGAESEWRLIGACSAVGTEAVRMGLFASGGSADDARSARLQAYLEVVA